MIPYKNASFSAKEWGVSVHSVKLWCRQNRISGAGKAQGSVEWLIPLDTKLVDVDRDKSGLGSKRYTATNPSKKQEAAQQCPGCKFHNVTNDWVYVCGCGLETCPDCAGHCGCDIEEEEE